MNPSKQPINVYFIMMVASALLMLIACILMFFESARYGSPWEKTGVPRVHVVEQMYKTTV
ncbi:MAG: hypothetical protein NTW52_04450 [Planctomycetota bacterium]|nr:hypothetical protein [Planctomycetota bacterium]